MSTWTQDELRQIDDADEFQIAALRRDGTLRGRRPVWVVRVGEDLYVRAAYGNAGRWHQVASDTGHARISAAGINKDVAVERADQTVFDQVEVFRRGCSVTHQLLSSNAGPYSCLEPSSRPGARSDHCPFLA